MLESNVLAPRVVRAAWSDVAPAVTRELGFRVSVTVDGATTTRTLSVPSWGLAVGVPGGLVLADVLPTADAAWNVTISPGAPVVEHVAQTAPQLPASVVVPPAFARTATLIAYGGASAVTLASGVVIAVAPGAPVEIAAQILTVTVGAASELAIVWEVYQ